MCGSVGHVDRAIVAIKNKNRIQMKMEFSWVSQMPGLKKLARQTPVQDVKGLAVLMITES